MATDDGTSISRRRCSRLRPTPAFLWWRQQLRLERLLLLLLLLLIKICASTSSAEIFVADNEDSSPSPSSSCPAGTYLHAQSNACRNCPAGTYNDAPGAMDETACRNCPHRAITASAAGVDYSGAASVQGCGNFQSAGYWSQAASGTVIEGGTVVTWSLSKSDAVSAGVRRTAAYAQSFVALLGGKTVLETSAAEGWVASTDQTAEALGATDGVGVQDIVDQTPPSLFPPLALVVSKSATAAISHRSELRHSKEKVRHLSTNLRAQSPTPRPRHRIRVQLGGNPVRRRPARGDALCQDVLLLV